MMRNTTHEMFQSKIAAAAGAAPSHVAIHCVHQHTAPPHDAGAEQLLDQQENPPKYRDLKSLGKITDSCGGSGSRIGNPAATV